MEAGQRNEGVDSDPDAALLSRILQCWAVQAPALGEPITSNCAEHLLVQFQDAVYMLVECHFRGKACRLVKDAYNLGIASGFYGIDSAVAVGLTGRFLDGLVCDQHEGGLSKHVDTGKIFEVGYMHGRTLFRCIGLVRDGKSG
ncbi:hypothetical protein WL35_17010 [Burkholderia ubonensis]|nr:hypothetical protein WL35_17010 [Burkholderia ubonensis]